MVNGRIPSVFSKTYVTPRRPYEKARLNQELKIIGEYGLQQARSVAVKYALAKIRKVARELLTLNEKNAKRLFQGKSLVRRLVRIGVLKSPHEARLRAGSENSGLLGASSANAGVQAGLAKSIHHARVLIRQRTFVLASRWSTIPSFVVTPGLPEATSNFSLKMPLRTRPSRSRQEEEPARTRAVAVQLLKRRRTKQW
nr:probable ribosomal protein - fruit fly (Drosophila melanogaster) [Drosophila melanogaster]